MSTGNQCAGEKSVLESGVEKANTEYITYLKQMVTSLLENQLNLSAALDETREACAHLNLRNSELEASSTQEMRDLQEELSTCRQREAVTALAYEDLRSRVEAIDQVIEQIPCLDVLFNSDSHLPVRLRALKCGNQENVAIESPLVKTFPKPSRSISYDEEVDHVAETDLEATADNDIPPPHHHHHVHAPISAWQGSKRAGSISPHSDSGCTSESHDEISLASLNSAHSRTYLAALHGQLSVVQKQRPNGALRIDRPPQQVPLKRSITTAIADGSNKEKGGWKLESIARSLRASISRFADKSEWKMEALVARQREARLLVLLNEAQDEVRRVESRCTGLTRRQNEQELRMGEKEKEIDRLTSQERELRRDLRSWQQRVFQLEAETQEILRNNQITELEMKSRLLEASMFVPCLADKEAMQAASSLFSEDVHRIKVGNEAVQLTTTTSTAVPGATPDSFSSNSQEDTSRPPPKFDHSTLQRRPRFASATSLSRLHWNPLGQFVSYRIEQLTLRGEEIWRAWSSLPALSQEWLFPSTGLLQVVG